MPMQTAFGNYKEEVENTVEDLENNSTVSRIWSGDHKVWKPSPVEMR
jgi:hypothetical protein